MAELIYFTMITASAASRAVNTAAKSQNVIITEPAGMAEMAARAGMRSWIIHGWRPTSAVTHPASEQIHTSATDSMATHCHQRCCHSQGRL